MAAGVSSPARPSPVYLHDPLSHTNNNSSNFNSTSSQHSVSTSSSPSLSSLACPPPAAPPSSSQQHLLLSSSPSNKDSPRRPPPSISPNSTAASTPTTLASSPLSSSSPFESAPDSVVLTRSRPQQSPVNSARGDPRLQKQGGFFAFAASAIDRTQSAIATISDQTVRHQRSLSRLSITGDSAAHYLSAEPSPKHRRDYCA